MTNYNNGKIYKIVCNKTGLVYIGSTTKRLLSERLSQHRYSYNYYVDGKRKTKTSSYQIIQNGDYYIELLELYPCSCKDELLAREKHYIKTIIPNVNVVMIGRTQAEWVNDNIERVKETKIKSYLKNKDKYSDEKKAKYENNKEEILAKNRMWKDNNIEKYKENQKKWQEENKDKIREYKKQWALKKKEQKVA